MAETGWLKRYFQCYLSLDHITIKLLYFYGDKIAP